MLRKSCLQALLVLTVFSLSATVSAACTNGTVNQHNDCVTRCHSRAPYPSVCVNNQFVCAHDGVFSATCGPPPKLPDRDNCSRACVSIKLDGMHQAHSSHTHHKHAGIHIQLAFDSHELVFRALIKNVTYVDLGALSRVCACVSDCVCVLVCRLRRQSAELRRVHTGDLQTNSKLEHQPACARKQHGSARDRHSHWLWFVHAKQDRATWLTGLVYGLCWARWPDSS